MDQHRPTIAIATRGHLSSALVALMYELHVLLVGNASHVSSAQLTFSVQITLKIFFS